MLALSPSEQKRYARHLVLPGFGEAKQLALKQAKVLVVGAGGLGAPLLLYLAAAGVGEIGIIDPDIVSLNNLQRQVLYGTEDIGRLKVEAAKERLLATNPEINIKNYPFALSNENALAIVENYDVVADGTDNFPTRYLINDACVLKEKVNVHAAIFRFEGQLSVFNYLLPDGSRSPNYRDLFPSPPSPDAVPDCAEGGVLGVLPGLLGSLQATEVIKVITGLGDILVGQLFMIDTLTMQSRKIRFKARGDYEIKELVDYQLFCGIDKSAAIPTITNDELELWQEHDVVHRLLDVRNADERLVQHIGGQHIPLPELMERQKEIDSQRPLVIYCQSGKRSAKAYRILENLGMDMEGIFHLEGGVNYLTS